MKNGPYILVKAPEDYPGKKYRDKYIYEHHLVWWQYTGQAVPAGYDVHHKNEVKTDNRIDNFELVLHRDHTSEHSTARKEEDLNISCKYCGQDFLIEARQHRAKTKAGQANFFCSRSHQVRQQHIDGVLNKSR